MITQAFDSTDVVYTAQHKFDAPKSYVTIPRDMTTGKYTTAKELGLLQALYHYDGFYSSQKDKLVWTEVSLRKLSRITGIHRNTLRSAIESLAKKHACIIINKVDNKVFINSPLKDEHGFIVDYRTTFERMNQDKLSLTERGVYLKLHLFWNSKTNQCFPTLQRLADECGLKVWQLSKILSKLHSLGYIRKMTVTQGCIKKNYYQITDKYQRLEVV